MFSYLFNGPIKLCISFIYLLTVTYVWVNTESYFKYIKSMVTLLIVGRALVISQEQRVFYFAKEKYHFICCSNANLAISNKFFFSVDYYCRKKCIIFFGENVKYRNIYQRKSNRVFFFLCPVISTRVITD